MGVVYKLTYFGTQTRVQTQFNIGFAGVVLTKKDRGSITPLAAFTPVVQKRSRTLCNRVQASLQLCHERLLLCWNKFLARTSVTVYGLMMRTESVAKALFANSFVPQPYSIPLCAYGQEV